MLLIDAHRRLPATAVNCTGNSLLSATAARRIKLGKPQEQALIGSVQCRETVRLKSLTGTVINRAIAKAYVLDPCVGFTICTLQEIWV